MVHDDLLIIVVGWKVRGGDAVAFLADAGEVGGLNVPERQEAAGPRVAATLTVCEVERFTFGVMRVTGEVVGIAKDRGAVAADLLGIGGADSASGSRRSSG